jgi:hypothetical protein
MADWLRPVFARTKTPFPSALNVDRPTTSAVQDATEMDEPSMQRLKPSSRVSSFNLLRSSTSPIPYGGESFLTFRGLCDPETIYHKPSSDQMAETVKVVMMNQSSVAPIPVQYNSAILHVLEAYQEMRLELNKNKDVIAELKESHGKDIKDFEALAKEWEGKERDYKAELKNLEVLLSRTDGGLEKVSLARTKSTVHGYVKTSDSIRSMITTIKERNTGSDSRDSGETFVLDLGHALTQDRLARD